MRKYLCRSALLIVASALSTTLTLPKAFAQTDRETVEFIKTMLGKHGTGHQPRGGSDTEISFGFSIDFKGDTVETRVSTLTIRPNSPHYRDITETIFNLRDVAEIAVTNNGLEIRCQNSNCVSGNKKSWEDFRDTSRLQSKYEYKRRSVTLSITFFKRADTAELANRVKKAFLHLLSFAA